MNWTKAGELERWGREHDAAKEEMANALAAGLNYMRLNEGRFPPIEIHERLERAHKSFLAIIRRIPSLE